MSDATEVTPCCDDELTAYDRETDRLIRSAAESVTVAEMCVMQMGAEAKHARNELKRARGALMSTIGDRAAGRGKPNLFSGKPAEQGLPAGEIPAELWRDYPIDRWTRFGVTEKDVEKLAAGELRNGGAHPIATVGDLNRFVTPSASNPGFARGYRDIKGIGAAGVDRISESEALFWAWWKGGGEVEFATERGVIGASQPGTRSGDGGGGGGGAAVAGSRSDADNPPGYEAGEVPQHAG